MDANWYAVEKGQTTGPFSMEGLKGKLARGEIGLETLVYGPGAPEWKPLVSVAALAGPLGVRSSSPSLLLPAPERFR